MGQWYQHGSLRKDPERGREKMKEVKREVSPPSKVVTRRQKRQDSEDSTDSDASSVESEVSSASSTVRREVKAEAVETGEKEKNGTDVETEDTMANLTTTFAGIFGKANLK